MSYQPFDVEDYLEAASDDDADAPTQFPPISETADDRKNWPKSCPFLHMKFEEMAIRVRLVDAVDRERCRIGGGGARCGAEHREAWFCSPCVLGYLR